MIEIISMTIESLINMNIIEIETPTYRKFDTKRDDDEDGIDESEYCKP